MVMKTAVGGYFDDIEVGFNNLTGGKLQPIID